MRELKSIQKEMELEENIRQVLNKSIDVLYNLSTQKVELEDGLSKITDLLTSYFFSKVDREEMDENDKIRLELLLAKGEEIVRNISTQKCPLYEGIVDFNKIVTLQPNQIPSKKPINRIVEEKVEPAKTQSVSKPKPVLNPQIVEGVNEDNSITGLMDNVVRQKELLDQALAKLNGSLSDLGLEICKK